MGSRVEDRPVELFELKQRRAIASRLAPLGTMNSGAWTKVDRPVSRYLDQGAKGACLFFLKSRRRGKLRRNEVCCGVGDRRSFDNSRKVGRER